jgi:hypothetical protein
MNGREARTLINQVPLTLESENLTAHIKPP